ncbi:restriction endonuclease subunit S [Blastococcus sp. VKM Ac-2987]|uniref:restriction endonuclease subunit S n=1 Tax=Blastococcus sp. VKM Ac-2987 TaxID=3004141 RepID=UPI0022AB7DF9|nr:restriction endonuclease subunit S [Blastococcus sp. VKM Ac-2987]MCZ2857433.1 restriction endonuclease subunit S [Blastococcus sp. VKM Ac-2987]
MSTPLDEWSTAPLGELVDILDYARIPVSAKERESRLGDVPYYGATGRVGFIDRPLYNEELVLLGEDGVQFFDSDKPKAYLINGPSWVNNHAHVLRAHRQQIDHRYLCHYLNHFNYSGYANGTTRLKLTQAAMRRMPIQYPDLAEQRRIILELEDHLSRLEAAQAYINTGAARADTLVAATLGADIALERAPTSRLVHLLAEPLANGRSVTTREGGYPVLRLTALTAGGVDLSQRKGGAWTSKEASPFNVVLGDFLVSRGNGSLRLVARGALVRDEPDGVAFPDTVIRVRVDRDALDPEYLNLIWNSRVVRRQIEGMARTTAGIYKVNQGHLESVEIPVPAYSDQRRLVTLASRAFEASAGLGGMATQLSRRVNALRRSLRTAAFSGRLLQSSSTESTKEMAGV